MYIVHINAMSEPTLKCNFTRDVHKHVLNGNLALAWVCQTPPFLLSLQRTFFKTFLNLVSIAFLRIVGRLLFPIWLRFCRLPHPYIYRTSVFYANSFRCSTSDYFEQRYNARLHLLLLANHYLYFCCKFALVHCLIIHASTFQ